MKPLPCPPALWPRFSALLDTALELDEPARAAWLAALPPEHEDLRPWLVSVFQAGTGVSTREYLERPQLLAAASEFAAGQQLGPWRLLRPLGSGGMGEVWLAERADGAYLRQVALKLPHAHLLSGALRARFARERNFLAGLSHPNIARFYDAGLSDQGQPWLALEFVEGVPIVAYSETHELDATARIALILQVGAAVQAAHARLIVHRDLKPANVLVTATGEVKLLDFGIAKLLDDEENATALTQVTGRAATLDYAAPEQLAGGSVTVATDVYALGVMLYELLTGAKPFAGGSRLGRLMLQRGEAALASSRVEGRRRRELQGDLDAILAKALESEPEQRYPSVEAFSADLDRQRAQVPIHARRIGRWQRAGKFLRRNRTAVGIATLLLAVVGVGIGGVLWQAAQTAEAARRAEVTKDFLLSVFEASDPRNASKTPLGQMTVRDLLDLSIARVERELAAEPELQIELLGAMGYALGLSPEPKDEARFGEVMNRRLDIARENFGDLHPVVIETKLVEAWGEVYYQNFPAARDFLDEADRLLNRASLNRSELRAQWWLLQGRVLRGSPGKGRERIEAFEKSARLYERHAPASTDYAPALANIATELLHSADFAKAEAQARKTIVLFESLSVRDGLSLAVTLSTLAQAQHAQGHLNAAAVSYRKAADMAVQTAGKQQGTYWTVLSRHARMLHQQGERTAAAALFEEVLRSIPAEWHKTTDDTQARELLASCWLAEGRATEALPLLEAAEKVYAERAPTEFDLRRLRLTLAQAYAQTGNPLAARARFQQALADYQAYAPPAHPDRLLAEARWAEFLIGQGELNAAAQVLDGALKANEGRPLAALALLQAAQTRLALAQNRIEEAQQYSEQALGTWKRLQGWRDVRLQPVLQRVHADVLAARGQIEAAQGLEDAAWQASQRYDAPESPSVRRRLMKAGA